MQADRVPALQLLRAPLLATGGKKKRETDATVGLTFRSTQPETQKSNDSTLRRPSEDPQHTGPGVCPSDAEGVGGAHRPELCIYRPWGQLSCSDPKPMLFQKSQS